MADHLGFLQAIIESPDDDAPRLIYADWLDEHGEPIRARFIRLQCQFASCLRPDDRPFLSAVSAEELVPEYRQTLLAPLLALGLTPCADRYNPGPPGGFAFYFRRGFVEDLRVYGRRAADEFVQMADQLFALTPLRNVILSDDLYGVGFEEVPGHVLDRLIRVPQLTRLQTLNRAPAAEEIARLRQLLGERRRTPRPLPPPLPPPQATTEEDIPF
jgi:uncharacterized protein (TIGR02996 family)